MQSLAIFCKAWQSFAKLALRNFAKLWKTFLRFAPFGKGNVLKGFYQISFLYKKTLLKTIFKSKIISMVFATNSNSNNSSSDTDNSATKLYGTPISTNGIASIMIDVSAALEPGIYVIVDTSTGKRYFGESELVAMRLAHHKKALEEGIHDNAALQRAWDNVAAPSKFQFIVLEWGSVWRDVNARKIKEKALIDNHVSTFGINACFNTLPGQNQARNIRRPVMINGTRYNSSRDAAR